MDLAVPNTHRVMFAFETIILMINVIQNETVQLCAFQGGLREAAAGGICDGYSYHDLFYGCNPNDDASDEEKGVESFGQKKRPPPKDDECDATETMKRRKRAWKFIDLTDAPA